MIRRLAYSAVSMASPPPDDDAAPASTTANVGGTNGLVGRGLRRGPVQDPHGERPDLEQLRAVLAQPAHRDHLEVQAPVRGALDEDRAGHRARRSPRRRPRPGRPCARTGRSSARRLVLSSCALRNPSITPTARWPRSGSAATTATRVTVARSTARIASGISAITMARPAIRRVENRKARDLTRSLYSRRATSPTLRARAPGPVGASWVTPRPPRRGSPAARGGSPRPPGGPRSR